jgi:hypothetical protein
MKRFNVYCFGAAPDEFEDSSEGLFVYADDAAAELARAADKLDAAYREIRERAGEAVDLAAKLEGLGVLYDELDAKCDAQAAVIERVRALADTFNGYVVPRARLLEAIATAPEHGDHENGCAWFVGGPCTRQCDAVHEHAAPEVYPPGTRGSSANTELGRVQRERDAANARVDAAERKADVACDDARSFAEAANRAESEAAALRAEITQANLDKGAALTELNQALHASEHWSKEAAHHRDEAAALREEVSELRDALYECNEWEPGL